MATTTFLIDDAEFDRATGLLEAVAGGVNIAARRAINDTLRTIRAAATRKVKKRLNIKSKDIRKEIKITRANKAPEGSGLSGRMTVGGSRLPLFVFGPQQTKKGVTYKIKTGGSRSLVPGAFLVEGTPQVFARRFVKGLSGKRVGRLPLRTLSGPSVVRIFEEEVLEALEDDTARILSERFDFHVDAQLKKAGL